MPRNPFSTYGRLARPLPAGDGKLFMLIPSTSTLISGVQESFPTDENGFVRTFTDPQSALNAITSGRGDVLYVMPGSYTVTTVLSTAATDFKIIGFGSPGAAMFAGSAASILTLTGANVEVTGLGFTIASTKRAITLTGASYCNIHDNLFYSTVGGTGSDFINMLTTACSFNIIRDNQFITNVDSSAGAITQASHITLLGVGNLIERNVFCAGRSSTSNAGAVTNGIVSNTVTDYSNTIRGNTFYEVNGATFTAGITSGASSVSGSIFPVANNFLLATAANAIVNTTGSTGFGNNIANGTV